VSERRYVVRPRAERDLDDQAYYYATVASPEIGHRFLVAAHDAFAAFATQPSMGWHSRLGHRDLKHLRVFRVKGFERILIVYLPGLTALRFCVSFTVPGTLQALFQGEGLDITPSERTGGG
jgi:plasmid stabilization system protein ParE